MNLSVAAAMLVFLVNPDSQWAGNKVLDYKIAELEELPEVSSAGYQSWQRIRDDQDVLKVSGFYMKHDLVELQTGAIAVPLFDDWLNIEDAQANMPARQMLWSFEELDANFAEQDDGRVLFAHVSDLTYQGQPFEFETTQTDLGNLYAFIAEKFATGHLGDMEVELTDQGEQLSLRIAWAEEGEFQMSFDVVADLSYREFRRKGYDADIWSASVSKPVQVSLANGSGAASRFEIDWSARPSVFEPLIELVLREVPNTLENIKG